MGNFYRINKFTSNVVKESWLGKNGLEDLKLK